MRKSLGKNVDRLFQDNGDSVGVIAPTVGNEIVRQIDINRIVPDPLQPRKFFSKSSLEGLAHSILESGIIQPLIVRPDPIKGFELVAGERRFRAAKMAGLKVVPVIVRDWDNKEASIAALVENIQREDLDPIERAIAFQELVSAHKWRQQDLASKLGLSRSQVANTLRLLKLNEFVRESLQGRKISEGHAKVLAGVSGNLQDTLAGSCINKGWSVRQLELAIEKHNKLHIENNTEKELSERAYFFQKLEGLISELALTAVQIKENIEGKGTIIFHYHNDDHFIELLNRLSLGDVLTHL